jgi:SAM-dependent methyltransferase
MSVFADYSEYYDLLYRDKDYVSESDFILKVIKKHGPRTASILDLGCGTGNHDFLISQKGYEVCGVDMSPGMLNKANQKRLTPEAAHLKISFHQGDIRVIRLGHRYDAVISLFHVMSYQVTDSDLQAAIETAAHHLRKGGIFIFDCWYGPAVLTDRPSVRVKRLENENIEVTRIAEPVLHPDRNLVDVNYHVFIKEKPTGNMRELKETHQMRYLFRPEIESIMGRAGMELVTMKAWLTDKDPGCNAWSVYCVGRSA